MGKRIGVIMAGGAGERFWPLSRPGRPKQLLCLTDPNVTMLEEAVLRVQPLFGEEGVYVATSSPLRDPVLACGVVAEEKVLTEPARRNTLGAQCWVVASLLARGLEDATVAMLTADHMIGAPDRFRGSVTAAMDIAEDHGGIVTLGMPPDRPETGYGYIEEDPERTVQARDGRSARRSRSFREKPSEETAEQFLAAGHFLWNGGMFFFTLPTFLNELQNAQPDAHAATLATAQALKRGDVSEATRQFERLPNISIDYAVMERATDVYVLRADFPWDDVGAWDAMSRTRKQDANGNVVEGPAIVLESAGCVVLSEDPSITIGALGLRDVVIVATRDAVLVCPKHEAQRVRLLAQRHSER
jgi:mannose-1-phosphate guanylyltransferase